MLLTKVKQAIDFRTKTKHKMPTDDILADLIQEATLYVANRADPVELTRQAIVSDETVIKLIEGGKVIVAPEYPDFTKTSMHLMIDELLSYAVINYVCFLLTQEVGFKALADDDIAVYRCEYSRATYGVNV